MRSLLFVPADSDKKLAKGLDSGTDALILDIEDSVALDRKPQARQMALAFLREHAGFRPLDCAELLRDARIPLDTGPTLRLFPHLHGTDGFFAAAMERA